MKDGNVSHQKCCLDLMKCNNSEACTCECLVCHNRGIENCTCEVFKPNGERQY